jgi:hypothetical protein
VQGTGDDVTPRTRQNEQRQYPENEGLVNQGNRQPAEAGGVEGEDLNEAREAAAQRGRTA